MITGVNYLTLSVLDLDRSFEFYSEILGCKPVVKWKKGAYLLAGDLWLCLCLDTNTRKNPLLEYTHIAFSINADKFEKFCDRLLDLDTKTWQENTSEGNLFYLLDPDGHKLELHVGDLWTRLEATKKNPYEDIKFFD